MGCLKNTLAGVGCATLLVIGGVAAYHYRAQIRGLVDSVRGEPAAWTADTTETVGRPSERALRSARRAEARMAAPDGPDEVTLSADELAAVIADAMDPVARRVLDSLRVVLAPERFAVEALLRTTGLDRGLLGPLDGILDEWEPVRMAGPAEVVGRGRVGWRPDELSLRAFPFPDALVPRLVNAIMGVQNGAVPIPVPATVGAIRIRADAVVFERRKD
jgi:hypothetical protein